MTWEEFKKKIEEAGLTVSRFANIVGVSQGSVYTWSNRRVPYWVESWLNNYIELNLTKSLLKSEKLNCEEFKEFAKKIFFNIDKKGLIDKVADNEEEKEQLVGYINYFIDPATWLDEEGNATQSPLALNHRAKARAKEAIKKAPYLDEETKREMIEAITDEVIKRLSKRKKDEKLAKNFKNLEQDNK